MRNQTNQSQAKIRPGDAVAFRDGKLVKVESSPYTASWISPKEVLTTLDNPCVPEGYVAIKVAL